MIQDLNGHKYDPIFKNIKPKEDDYILCYRNNRVFLIDNKIPKVRDIECNNIVYGFTIDNISFFINIEESNYPETEVSVFRELEDKVEAFAIITGYHLYNWYHENIYCGTCGEKHILSETERAIICEKCGKVIYPNIHPAVIVGIINGDKILLTKYRKGYSNYALVAGFTEMGETLEDTVKREVKEEVGLDVEDIRYYKSQPWGLSGSILAGFFVKAKDMKITLEEDELKEAKWFTKDEIDLSNDNTSLTREMIMLFKSGEYKKYS